MPCVFISMKQRVCFSFAQNICRGSVNFMVFALMGFPYESAPPPSQVASSLQIRRSKLRHSHEGDTTVFHHVNHHAWESAMSGALGLWYSCPGQFRQLMIHSRQQHHSWASAGQHSLTIYEYIPHQ